MKIIINGKTVNLKWAKGPFMELKVSALAELAGFDSRNTQSYAVTVTDMFGEGSDVVSRDFKLTFNQQEWYSVHIEPALQKIDFGKRPLIPSDYIERNIKNFLEVTDRSMKPTPSRLQRVCRIGYNQALDTLEEMERRKIVTKLGDWEWQWSEI
ncbi:hypothetical protein [Oceanobacter kriegii]|uniref:hypothetical protein n=1 Tax=Oceanobacter kriegii TaxID=64972 RepID=UPI000481F0D2|nr:hypothetical protein [Oceanobacter kriegii]